MAAFVSFRLHFSCASLSLFDVGRLAFIFIDYLYVTHFRGHATSLSFVLLDRHATIKSSENRYNEKVFIYSESQMREVDHSDIFRQAIAIGPTGPIVDSNISSSSTRISDPSLRLHVYPDKIPLDSDNNATTHTYIILHRQQKTCYTSEEGPINITQLALEASRILGPLKFERQMYCITIRLWDAT